MSSHSFRLKSSFATSLNNCEPSKDTSQNDIEIVATKIPLAGNLLAPQRASEGFLAAKRQISGGLSAEKLSHKVKTRTIELVGTE